MKTTDQILKELDLKGWGSGISEEEMKEAMKEYALAVLDEVRIIGRNELSQMEIFRGTILPEEGATYHLNIHELKKQIES